MKRVASFFLFIVSACGSRSSLTFQDPPDFGVDSGHPEQHPEQPDAALLDAAIRDAARADAHHDASARCTGRLQGWSEVDVVLGDPNADIFERLVPAAASDASAVWLAGAGRSQTPTLSNSEIRLLRVEVHAGSPRIAESITLDGTESWQPLALAVANDLFALVARGANGEAWVALFTHDGAEVHRAAIAQLTPDWANNIEADVAWAGGDIVLAAVRLGSTDPFVVQRRDAQLFVRWSATPANEKPVTFRLRPDGSELRTRTALYDLTAGGLSVRARGLDELYQIGSTSTAWAGIDANDFVLEHDNGSITRGKWPGSSWASNGFIPVYESAQGVFVFGNVELAPFIGWFEGDGLEWIAVPHIGGGGIAIGTADDVGAFFAELEIPHWQIPLRYWGCTR